MINSQALISFLTGIILGITYGFIFNKGKTSSVWLTILFSVGRYAVLVAATLLINMIFPLDLLLYVTGFFCAFWVFIHKTIRIS